jgi:hypothetical protein
LESPLNMRRCGRPTRKCVFSSACPDRTLTGSGPSSLAINASSCHFITGRTPRSSRIRFLDKNTRNHCTLVSFHILGAGTDPLVNT